MLQRGRLRAPAPLFRPPGFGVLHAAFSQACTGYCGPPRLASRFSYSSGGSPFCCTVGPVDESGVCCNPGLQQQLDDCGMCFGPYTGAWRRCAPQ